MSAAEIIELIKKLPPEEKAAVIAYVENERVAEPQREIRLISDEKFNKVAPKVFEASGDKLLRLVRKKLRRDHGFVHGGQRGWTHFGVRCVWSEEPPVYPWANGTCAAEPEPGSNLTLDCESGYGTAMFVTAAFGLAAAGEVVRAIAKGVSPVSH